MQLTKAHLISNSGISAACQVQLVLEASAAQGGGAQQQVQPVYQEAFACASKSNDIAFFSFQTGTCLNTFYAHDDCITSLLFHDQKLISVSND